MTSTSQLVGPVDLAFATAIAVTSERLLEQPDLGSLWPLVATEAARVIPADQVAVVRHTGVAWQLVVACDRALNGTERDLEGAVNAVAGRGWLCGPARIDDLSVVPGWSTADLPVTYAGWRSLLVVRISGVANKDLTLLVWASEQPECFAEATDLAQVLGQHVTAAVRTVWDRETLSQAVAARTRIGQAQGILMARHQLTAEQAFQFLKQLSQRSNVKLRTVADEIISGQRPALSTIRAVKPLPEQVSEGARQSA